jgi:adenine-specific DNA-methyltransferase
MSRLTNLIAQAKAKDADLGRELEREFRALSARRAFGLNFERHRPENVELPGRPIRKGDKVRILPERGSTKKGDQRLWKVMSLSGKGVERTAMLSLLYTDTPEQAEAAVADLCVVAEFRDYIYPGLVSTGKVERGGDKPFHTVINGENFHALEALTFTHRGKVDAIYIDPPYNTGARDWKYNNDYVEGDDQYRHSKWLAMMERRLTIARELLNPSDSVLIVTIDEKEYLRLGLLLEQVFPESVQQMVTIVINPNGVARGRELARVEEYAFFLFIGKAGPSQLAEDYLVPEIDKSPHAGPVRWERLMRGGSNSRRQDRPNLFYPVFVNPDTQTIDEVGDSLPLGKDPKTVQARPGLDTVWPIRTSGEEANWRLSPSKLRELLDIGYARVGSYDSKNDRWSLSYLGKGQVRRIEEGEIRITGKRKDGSALLEMTTNEFRKTPKTVWNRPSHKAGEYGSSLVKKLLGGRAFPFPKSLFAVEDTLRSILAEKPEAVVLDFFAGSGTTAHAVMRLNKQDDGKRQCISVTNNEVGADEQANLRKEGLRPGDAEWEQWGICDYITKPRLKAAITGQTPQVEPIKGDYKFTDEFPMADGFAENAEFFTLTYETPVAVSHNRAFARIAPLLWMRAGSEGRRIDALPEAGWEVADSYGLLTELDGAGPFADAIAQSDKVRVAYIVTDDERRFQAIVRQLPGSVEPVRLYESYLTNFRFAMGR